MRRGSFLQAIILAVVWVAGCSSTGQGGGNPPPQIVVTIAPLTATVIAGQMQQFTATVTGTSNTSVTWAVNGTTGGNATVGTISLSGLYTAPNSLPNPPTVSVTATSVAGSITSAPAVVTITWQQIVITIAPLTATVITGQTQQFTATVTGTSNTSVTWAVNGTTGGNATVGTISLSGLYTAPNSLPNPATVNVTATSVAGSITSAPAVVAITSQVSGPVTISPGAASIEVFASQQFSAAINGQPTTAVTWQVNAVPHGNTTTGTISASGLFSAPHAISNNIIPANGAPVTVQVTAVSTTNTANVGSATVTLTVPNQPTQTPPIKLGTSGGNANDSVTSGGTITCCGGTLGSLVKRGGANFILSNNHVLARNNAASAGENIIQPGLIDTGSCTSQGAATVANLTQFFNLPGTSTPKIDAAIAQVVPGAVDANGNILLLGSATDANGVPVPGQPCTDASPTCGLGASVNLAVAKSGRTTGLTCSTVSAINVTTSVNYVASCGSSVTKFSTTFTNQVSVVGGDFSGAGDSGSLIVSQSTADPVAILFAGSDVDSVGNPVSDVLNFFASGSSTVSFVGGAHHAVIGCTLPGPLAAMVARLAVQKIAISNESLNQALLVRDVHASELLALPEVQAVGVGASYDNPGEPAILLFVTGGLPQTALPAQVEGVRTRIIAGDLFPMRGPLTTSESATLEQSTAQPQLFYSISDSEVARAKAVKDTYADEWMKQPGVQGVGITSSADAPEEAALMIFLIRGETHPPIPAVIDGLRTRIRESSRFRAGHGDAPGQPACRMPGAQKMPRKTASKVQPTP
jgi:hypothetical protein